MSSTKMLITIFILILTTSCSLIQPFVDRRRNAGVEDIKKLYVGRSTPSSPAICYNPLITNSQEIQALADAECKKHNTGTHAIKTHTTKFTCKMFLPSHDYFKCVK
ncbi:MAG: hypothetical protein IJW75_00380 [Alphaproteobacteria bacterium]|nr:hypothetical protein [Alphaproteobacteria bacterium]